MEWGRKTRRQKFKRWTPKQARENHKSRENPVPTHSQRETQRRRDGVRTTERQGHRENRIPSTETRKQEKRQAKEEGETERCPLIERREQQLGQK